MTYKFANANCVYCHEKLPTKSIEPSGEEDVSGTGNAFKVGNCPKCGGAQRLVEVEK